MKNVLCFFFGIFLITLTYYLHNISYSLAHSASTAPPSSGFAVIMYIVGGALIVLGLISKEK